MNCRPRWSSAELAQLRLLYLRGDEVGRIAISLNVRYGCRRTKNAVQVAAHKLGLHRYGDPRVSPEAPPPLTTATAIIDAFLRKPSGSGDRFR